MIYQLAGYLSGIAILLSFIPYIRDIFKGTTKPERVSWFIWSVVGIISFASQFAKGASYSLFMTGAGAAGDLIIFLLGIKYGLGGFSKRDKIGLAGCGIALVLWYFTQEATFALFTVIAIDAIGAILTILKTYERPTTETKISWVLTALGGALACVAVGSFDLILLAYPVYIFMVGSAIVLAIHFGKK